MTDAHCHVSCGDPSVSEFLVGRDFFGVHPWETLCETTWTCEACETGAGLSSLACPASRQLIASLRAQLLANPRAGVGEIGLDRLKRRDISPLMREVFEAQLSLAGELGRPVVLHGAKCWGQVVAAVKRVMGGGLAVGDGRRGGLATCGERRAFLFHGFSRSDGLIPDIVKLDGFISVGPAVLNDHAVNYRALVKKIPPANLLVETDRTEANAADCPSIRDVLAKTADLLGLPAAELERITDENAERFMRGTVPEQT